MRHPIRIVPSQGDREVLMYVGPARDGTVLEVGLINDEEDHRVIHAQPARAKYWP